MTALRDAAVIGAGATIMYAVGVGPWILWIGGALVASALGRAYVERRRATRS